MDKIGNDFFKTIIDKIEWDEIGMANTSPLIRLQIALMVELNMNIASLCLLLQHAMGVNEDSEANTEPKIVICPKCKEEVVPNGLGYCPKCKTDLAKYIKSEEYHLGDKVE